MSVIAYPQARYVGNNEVRVYSVVAQAGDIVVCLFESIYDGTYMRSRLSAGWEYLGTFDAKGLWYTKAGYYTVAARRYEAGTVGEDIVTVYADASNIISAAPFAPVAFQFRGEASVTVAGTVATNYYTTYSDAAFALAGGVTCYVQGLSLSGPGAFLEVTAADGSKSWVKEHLKVAAPGASTASYGVVKRVHISWNDGRETDNAYPGADALITHWLLTGSIVAPAPQAMLIMPAWVDVTAQWVVQWDYRAALAGDQTKYVLKRVTSPGGVASYWNEFTKLWVGAEYENTSAVHQSIVPANNFATGGGYDFAVKVKGTVGDYGAYSPLVLVNIDARPTATVGIQGGDGSTTEGSVLVVPSGTPSVGGQLLTQWEGVVIETATGETVASNTSTSFVPWLVTVPRAGAYEARIRVQQTKGAWSNWATASMTFSVIAPTTPTVSVASDVHETSGAPGFAIDVDFPWAGTDFPWSSKRVSVRVERDDGAGWVTVGLVGPYLGRTQFAIGDYGAPSGHVVKWRIRGEAQDSAGNVVAGDWVETSTAQMAIECGWIIDIAHPENAVRAKLMEQDSEVIDTGTQPVYTIDSPTALVTGGVTRRVASGLRVRTYTGEDAAALRTMLSAHVVLMVRWFNEIRPHGPAGVDVPEDLWVLPIGEFASSRPVLGPYATRDVSFKYVAQDMPTVVDG